MKKVMLSALALGLLLFSCEKEEVTPGINTVSNENVDVIEDNIIEDENQGYYSQDRRDSKEFHSTPFYTKCWCTWPGTDCLGFVVVVTGAKQVYNDIITASSNSEDERIKQLFIDNTSLLTEEIDVRFIRGFIEGAYTLVVRDGLEEGENVTFFIFENVETQKAEVAYTISIK